ncbi:ABC transporter ATP-binding protein [Amygdalobacter nucleatus]|uniref:ABC transporter, ATP-binding protein n=1 Tax=Amygdalobacter nucleatus TaxID=3029274 RepID=A0A133Y7S2_9FIRM|nr:ABC transporter ATP-binding protein [Amygdalobacter nucleatus]KXB39258.1 ABC transporter, ATP-binding protein [Amygdalobacter nucleatus]MDF0485418.1 ABC transporter ATP-binding protein [Amygdalobacter nucleatus]
MKNLLRKYFAITEKGASDLIKAVCYSFVTFCFNMLPAGLLLLLLNQLLFNQMHSNAFYIIFAVICLLLLGTALTIEYESTYNATYKEAANLRIKIAEKLSTLPLSYFGKHNLSDLAQTIINDVTQIEHAMSHAMPKLLALFIFTPLLFILMLIGNYKMALAVICPSLISLAFVFIARKFATATFHRYYLQLRDNSESFQECIELAKEINNFNLFQSVKEKLDKQMSESEKIHIKSEFSSAFIMLFANICSELTLAVTMLTGLILMRNGEINLIYFLGYTLACIKFKEIINIANMFFMEMYYLNSMNKRIMEIMQQATASGEEQKLSSFDIVCQNVSFAYDNNLSHEQVLQNLSLTAKQGEVTALVGASGCGKTTLLRLISRFYDYQVGTITVGGIELTKIAPSCLYRYLSIVFQNVVLFDTSIMENIRIGRPDASDAEVLRAAKLANIDFVDNLPNGWQTKIGENGVELSGGERQRLSIARAFLKDAPILILDEIAANLDIDNEAKIQAALSKLVQNKTVIVISHRLKAIENADKIIVLANGKVEAIGTHVSLLNSSPVYQNLQAKSRLIADFSY